MRSSRAGETTPASFAGLHAFWRQTALLLVVLACVNGSNYLFHVVISRMLGPADYGALAALLAIILVLSVPFGVIQTAIADKTATLRSTGREDDVRALGGSALKTTMPFAWGAGLVVALFAPLLSVFLDVDIVSALLLAPFVVASVPTSVALGVLQGEHRFQALAALQLTTTVLRLALGITLVWAGLGVIGAVLATALSAALTVPLAFRSLRVGRRAWRAAHRTLAAVRGDLAPGAPRADLLLAARRGRHRPRAAFPRRRRVRLLLERRPPRPRAAVPARRNRRRRVSALRGRASR